MADDTKSRCGMAEDRASVQTDLEKLQNLANISLVKMSKEKQQVL